MKQFTQSFNTPLFVLIILVSHHFETFSETLKSPNTALD